MDHERWLVSPNAVEDEDEDEEEALSLSDLPLIHQWRKENKEKADQSSHERQGGEDQEFDFCSLERESEMCAADEVFFKGRILPLRHSVSSEKGYDARHRIFRSDSMDHYYSSRSSSISSSHQSSTSATTSSSSAARYKPKLPPRIQFHSHPSPSPRLSNHHAAAAGRNSVKKSSVWNVLRLGLVAAPPEIAFHDLKARSGSRRSTSSNSSGGGGNKEKTRARILGGGCTCAADAVDAIAAPRVVIIKRSASDGDPSLALRLDHADDEKLAKKKQAAKKQLSHHRTFEWLKQLSVEGAAADQS